MPHPTLHFFTALAALVVTFALLAAVRNRVIRRRLSLSLLVGAGAAVLHLVVVDVPGAAGLVPHALGIEKLLVAFALINAGITLLLNPWFENRASDRAPAIVQDAIVATLVIAASVLVFNNSTFLTGSAIAAAVVGFALQDTLGNAFAGLAIQIERPFRVGHWITVADHEGLVTAITWRATKIRTKAGNLVIVPNNVIAREAINNFSEPAAPTRLHVDVGAAYQTPPNDVRAALQAVLRDAKYILASPPPEILLYEFGGSAITYRVRFWIDDYDKDEIAKDGVRAGIYYEFRRRNIEIPYPIQVEYSREEPPVDTLGRRGEFARAIGAVPVFATLPADVHEALARAAEERLYGDGEIVVHEGDAGRSMFLVSRGTVRVVVGADRREVAMTPAGGYFGEMSLLTGDPRSATVIAAGDATVLEISADAFATYVKSHPEVIDQLAHAAATRRRELDQSRSASDAGTTTESFSLAQRIKAFFGLD